LYEVPDSDTIRISTMLGRLTIPVRLQEMLVEASSEGKNLTQKLQQELPTLDISALDSMELFSNGPLPSAPASNETHIMSRDPVPAAAPAPKSPEAKESKKTETDLDAEGRSYSIEEYVKLKKSKTPAG
jgi:hypothetical protein